MAVGPHRTIDEVCNYLENREVGNNVLAAFRANKVDGQVITIIDDCQLNHLGLTTLGDQVLLRDYCRNSSCSKPLVDLTGVTVSPAVPVGSSLIHLPTTPVTQGQPSHETRKKRKAEILKLLRSEKGKPFSDKPGEPSCGRQKGRPKQFERIVLFGLRVTESQPTSADDDFERKARLIRNPLGDKNFISLKVSVDKSYTNVLDMVRRAFFPHGRNPVIGFENDFTYEVVNGRNQNVDGSTESSFTLDNYTREKMIKGTLKLYLLCTLLFKTDSDSCDLDPAKQSESDSDSVSLPDILPTCTSDVEVPVDLDSLFNQCTYSNDNAAGAVSTLGQISDMSVVYDSHIDTSLPVTDSSVLNSTCVFVPDLATTESICTPIQYSGHTFTPLTPSGEVLGRQTLIFEQHGKKCSGAIEVYVEEAISKMEDSKDPVEMLRIFQQQVMIGRPLETTPAEVNEGETASIFVSRHDLLPSAMQEILNMSHDEFSLPLEVTFYGEKAQDLGGPRREFFRLILKELIDEKHELFEKRDMGYVLVQNQRNVKNNFFYGAGILCCLSMLQQGPLPCFMEESHMTKICSNSLNTGQTLTEAESQFQKGFNILGIVNLISRKPVMKFLLRSTAQKAVTYKQLMNLLEPSFSEKGTTRRSLEETVYNLYTAYLKEVAGRREGLTLGSILQFTTGSEFEPVLGFKTKPTLVFRDDLPWSLPQANTCICQLTLPSSHGMPRDKETLYARFDLAFANAYFGFV